MADGTADPGRPGDLTAGSGRPDEEPTTGGGSVPLAREELRTTFEYQVQRLREIDGKAIELLKANLLLIGLVVTAGSILVQTDVEIGQFTNAFTVAGVGLLLFSTGLAGVTYTSSNLRGGLGPDAAQAAIGDADGAFDERVVRSYGRWIDYNARMIAVNDILVTVTVLAVVVSFVYVLVGLVIGFAPIPTAWSIAAFALLTAVSGWVAWLVYNMDHLGPRDPRWEGTFDGVRLSKGTSREEGLEALKVMLGRTPEDEE